MRRPDVRNVLKIEDRTGHSRAVHRRRENTANIIVHRIGDTAGGVVGRTFEEIEHFFTRDPEGVATIAIGGDYATKKRTFESWWPNGVPAKAERRTAPTRIPRAYQEAARVAYHFGIAEDGSICQWLPSDVMGAHTRSWNGNSIAIACIRGARDRGDLPPAQERALFSLLIALCACEPSISRVYGHKEADEISHHPHTKDCPGFSLKQIGAEAIRLAEILRIEAETVH